MLTLTRQTRLYWPVATSSCEAVSRPHSNRWHSLERARPFASYLMVETTVAGEPDKAGGYLLDIREMDRLLQRACQSAIENQKRVQTADVQDWNTAQLIVMNVWRNLFQAYETVGESLPQRKLCLRELVWRFSPYLAFRVKSPVSLRQLNPLGSVLEKPMTTDEQTTSNSRSLAVLLVTQQYEFAAAHRLHCPGWTAEQNRDVFGKCNRPSGHGHNYRLDVTVQWAADQLSSMEEAPPALSLPDMMNRLVNQHAIEKLDHRFLNLDVPEFADLNPTVENIAQVVFSWLRPAFPDAIRLNSIRVYETEKTWAEVSANPAGAP